MDIRSDWMTTSSSLTQRAKNRFDLQRNESLEGFTVTIDGKSEKVVIQEYSNPLNQDRVDKKIFCELNSVIKCGSVVVHNSKNYLTMTVPESNQAYLKAKIEHCNNTLHIQTGETKTITGYDDLGRPIISSTPVYTDLPCVVKSKITSIDDNTSINLPVGRLLISIPYSASIAEGMEFSMYGKTYFIIGTDLTKVIGSVGVLDLFADRKT